MADSDTSDKLKPTTQQVPGNPTGKGGFGDNPQNRNPGGWKKEMVFSYQYRRFMNMTVAEIEEYSKLPKENRTVVEDLAYNRVIAAKKSLPDVKEMTDRTEGKAPQAIDVTSGGEKLPTVIIEGLYGTKPGFRISNQAPEADEVAADSNEQSS